MEACDVEGCESWLEAVAVAADAAAVCGWSDSVPAEESVFWAAGEGVELAGS